MAVVTDAMLSDSAVAAADMIRRREVSSTELTRLVLDRIDAVNPMLNAVVELRREAALLEAASADQAIRRGEEVGQLHGVPMTIKEAFHVAGLHTTWGNPAFRNLVSDRDAVVPRRLRHAGAVITGTTNVAYMLGDFAQTVNDLYGATNNPWDTGRTPGGSSGGSAAAVAAGMSFLEYGSDLVGSIRIPASFCGVYGLKPSTGTVPLTGFQPPGPSAPPSEMTYMSSVGPLARAASDLRTALSVTAGPEDAASKAYSWALAPPRHRQLADFRAGVVLDDSCAPVTGEVGAVLSDTVDELEFLHSARSLADRLEKQRLMSELFGWVSMHDGAHERAHDVQQALTELGSHRSAGAVDLLIAATAERERLTVLCDDRDYLTVAAVTGQAVKLVTDI